MKQSILIFLIMLCSLFGSARNEIKKANKGALYANYVYLSKYNAAMFQYHYTIYKNYTAGMSGSIGFKNISIPDYVESKLDHNYVLPYDKLRNVDLLIGRKIVLTKDEDILLHLSAGLSYLYFQRNFHYLPFNCQLANDVELTQALGVPLQAIMNISTKHRIGFNINFYTNLNPEKILIGVGFGMRMGKLIQ